MSEYLDKTGLSYLWGKIKGKLNNKADKSSLDSKADNDKYKVINISTKKGTSGSVQSQNSFSDYLRLDNPADNHFEETFPSGYHILCLLAVRFAWYTSEAMYNANNETSFDLGYYIRPIENYEKTLGHVQKWTFNTNVTMSIYGVKYYYTLLLEKD
jgi:hypothetical protein